MTSTTKYNAEQLIQITEIFRSIAFPVRLKVLELLDRNDCLSVSQLVEITQLEPSLLSHHLSKMKHSGVLTSHRVGRNIFYSLKLKQITSIFNCIDKCNIFT